MAWDVLFILHLRAAGGFGKVGCLFTINRSGIRWVVSPLVARMVVEYTPPAMPGVAVSVRMLFPDPGAVRRAGLNAAVIPAGNPAAEKATGALKPPLKVTFIEMLLLDRAAMESEFTKAVVRNAGVAVASLQCSTRTEAFTEPKPVA
jgi:hypothetical protein